MSEKTIYHLVINIEKEDYVLGSLSIKSHKDEMSYLFHFSEDTLANPLNINSNKRMSGMHHITWHKGLTHLKLSDGSTLLENYIPFLPDQNVIKPILVEGFILNGASSHLVLESYKFRTWHQGKKVRILALTEAANFSLLFFLIPKNWSFDEVCVASSSSPQLLFSLGQICLSICTIENAFTGWDLLVCVSPYMSYGGLEHANMNSQQRAISYQMPQCSMDALIKNAYIYPHIYPLLQVLRQVSLQKSLANFTQASAINPLHSL